MCSLRASVLAEITLCYYWHRRLREPSETNLQRVACAATGDLAACRGC
jgi:hypothetical protein